MNNYQFLLYFAMMLGQTNTHMLHRQQCHSEFLFVVFLKETKHLTTFQCLHS